MQFGFNWLKELSGTKLSLDEVVERLTMLGIEVESVKRSERFDFAGIVVGEIIDAAKIEGSDHLSVCQVSVGDEADLQIVCGAPNVAKGQRVPVATVGSVLPGGMKIRKAKLRGTLSQGMICSEAELGISEESSGIMVLNGDASKGQAFGDLVHFDDDPVIEVAITPNRPDCLGMIGIAREICLSEGRAFKYEYPQITDRVQPEEEYKVRLDDSRGCPRYTARVIRDVKIGPSPDWLAQRLKSAGVRPINNVVDATNCVMLLTGQPLHAFDLDKLENQEIVVRLAQTGENFVTLDGKSHELKENNLLICDGETPVALAGVMGGENSEVSDDTTNLLLESAYFSPETIRKTVRQLSIFTEASRRFERGVDPNGCANASDIATHLILETAGGMPTSNLNDAYPSIIHSQKISFRPQRAVSICGAEIDDATMSSIFEGLGCTVEKNGKEWNVTPPTFRPDLVREIDLVEEVIRVFGYDEVAANFNDRFDLQHTPNRNRIFADTLRKTCLNISLSEIVTFSMTNEKFCLPFVEEQEHLVGLLNPLSEDLAVLRPSLLSTMLPAVSYNVNRKQTQLRFFEIGSAFHKAKDGTIHEFQHLGGVLSGNRFHESWQSKASPISFFDLKGIAIELLHRTGLREEVMFNPIEQAFFEFGAAIKVNDTIIGTIGKISPQVCDLFDITQDVFGFEIDCGRLKKSATPQEIYHEISPFPEVERDLAIVLDKSVAASDVEALLKKEAGSLLTQISLFDIYEGKSIPTGKKSLAYALKFQSTKRTIKSREVEKLIDRVLKKLKKNFDATLRG